MIYLDNCATTKPRKEVVDAMVEALEFNFANPSSLHRLGLKAEEEREKSRKIIADFIGVDKNFLFFTSGGTEANNIAIQGAVRRNKNISKKIMTSSIEHASILDQFKKLEEAGYECLYIPVDRYGHLDEEYLFDNLSDLALLSLTHVNNEIGSIIDLKDLIKRIRKHNKSVHIHADGVQAFGRIPFKLSELGVDSYSISSHKIHGPKGVGCLYLKKPDNFPGLFLGGGQEKNLRSGTENMPGIVGFGKATEIVSKNFQSEYAHIIDLKKYCKKKIEENFKDFEFNFDDNSSPYNFNVGFYKTRGEVLLHFLENDEIYISTSSACTSNSSKKMSHVLSCLGISKELMEGSIRFCFSYDITREMIDIFLEKLSLYVDEIRSIMR